MVLYKPTVGELGNLYGLLSQLDLLIIVCNGKIDLDFLDQYDSDKWIKLENLNNQGLGRALNQGVSKAFELGYEFCFTFDQDTKIVDFFEDEWKRMLLRFDETSCVGIFAANYHQDSKPIRRPVDGTKLVSTETVIQSGALFSKRAFEICGVFREDYFIEGIDIEYCLRTRANGYKILITDTPLMWHGAGQNIPKKLLGKTVYLANHDEQRLYLQFRNLVSIMKRYFIGFPRWGSSVLLSLFKKIILLTIFESNRFAKFLSIVKGIWDGFTKAQPFENSDMFDHNMD